MITVICTQCRAQLEMDEAFAGGVCRCQFCGTIQTVPSLSKIRKRQAVPSPAAAPAAAGVTSVPPGGVAPRPHGAPPPADNGLDALAEAVASSSGLGRGSLRAEKAGNVTATEQLQTAPSAPHVATPAPVEYAAPPPLGRRKTIFIFAAATAAALLLFFLGAGFVWVRTGPVPVVTPLPGPAPRPAPNPDSDSDPATPAIPDHPHFCGVDLSPDTAIVYVLDRGQATAEAFDTLKEATYRSLQSLKPNQRFAILFWNNGGDDAAYPPDGGLAPATPGELEAARQQFAEVYAGGRADPRTAVERAAALKPSSMILVTGKAFDLDPELVDLTTQSLAGARTKVHTFALNNDDGSTVLPDISKATHGQSRVLTRRELRHFSD